MILVFSIAFAVVLWLWNHRHDAAALMVTLAGSQVFTQLGKLAFHRPRPKLPVFAEHSFSFPSGHATVAMAFYGFLAYILVHQAAKWQTKVNYFFAATVTVLLIGVSRLYLGVHYLSDVWSGYLVGALWLVIGIALSRYLEASPYQSSCSGTIVKARRVIGSVLISSAIVFYVGFAATYHPKLITASAVNSLTTILAPEDIFQKSGLKNTESVTGEKELPINIVISAKDDAQLVRAFQTAGWLRADNIGLSSLAKTIQVVFFGSVYPAAPMRPMFWDARANDFCFEISAEIKDLQVRRAVRLWKTSFVNKNGDSVYVGQVSLAGNLISELTHRMRLDIDAQRKLLCRNLVNAGVVDNSLEIHPENPTSNQNVLGDPLVTDGGACVLKIKPEL